MSHVLLAYNGGTYIVPSDRAIIAKGKDTGYTARIIGETGEGSGFKIHQLDKAPRLVTIEEGLAELAKLS